MPFKLVGYYNDSLSKVDYLVLELPVFKLTDKDEYYIQRAKEGNQFTKVDIDKVQFVDFEVDLVLNDKDEQHYLAFYNDECFYGVKTIFINKLTRFIKEYKLTDLNLFSVYSLLSLRYETFISAQKIIENNELSLTAKLSFRNFSFPSLISVQNSKQSLFNILLFYSRIAFNGYTKGIIFNLFQIHDEDYKAITLNKTNYLVIGNYYINADDFIGHLSLIMIGLHNRRDEESRLLRKFIFSFLGLFKFISKPLCDFDEEIETIFDRFSNQQSVLKFNNNAINTLISAVYSTQYIITTNRLLGRHIEKCLAEQQ